MQDFLLAEFFSVYVHYLRLIVSLFYFYREICLRRSIALRARYFSDPLSRSGIAIELLNLSSPLVQRACRPLIFPLFAGKTCQIWISRGFSDRPDSVRTIESLKSVVPPLRPRDNSRFASAQLVVYFLTGFFVSFLYIFVRFFISTAIVRERHFLPKTTNAVVSGNSRNAAKHLTVMALTFRSFARWDNERTCAR